VPVTLLLKLVLAPILVVGSSWVGRRWGDRVAGTLVAFPIVAGPILLITSLEHGVRFGARAASASLLGLVSLAVFVVSFAYASRRYGWLPSLAVSWTATVVADVLLAQWAAAPGWGIMAVLAAVWVAHRLLAGMDGAPVDADAAVRPWYDLPARAAATAALVLTVTGMSALGPVVTGILAPFPIATSVVAAFVLAQQGSTAVVRTLAGVTRGLVGFATFCFLLAVLLVPLGVPGAFLTATAGALVAQVSWIAVASRRHDDRTASADLRAQVYSE
jgi:hypothetical protein